MSDPMNLPECLCHGRGWYLGVREGTENDYIPDMVEKYCTCPAAKRAMERDGVADSPSGDDK